MSRILIFTLIFGFFLFAGCNRGTPLEVFHRFENRPWQRFDNLTFEIPVKKAGKSYDVQFITWMTRDFPFDELSVNMVMNTPSGEERIGEYTMKVKSGGGSFLSEFKGDSCENILLLKRGLFFAVAGILKVEIENLTPRMQTTGILGAGIRLTESGK